jgi:hypothetical protein
MSAISNFDLIFTSKAHLLDSPILCPIFFLVTKPPVKNKSKNLHSFFWQCWDLNLGPGPWGKSFTTCTTPPLFFTLVWFSDRVFCTLLKLALTHDRPSLTAPVPVWPPPSLLPPPHSINVTSWELAKLCQLKFKVQPAALAASRAAVSAQVAPAFAFSTPGFVSTWGRAHAFYIPIAEMTEGQGGVAEFAVLLLTRSVALSEVVSRGRKSLAWD